MSFFLGILLDLAMHRVTTQIGVVLFHLQPIGLGFLVALTHVAGHWLALALGLRALENDYFPGHKLIFLCLGFGKFLVDLVLGR